MKRYGRNGFGRTTLGSFLYLRVQCLCGIVVDKQRHNHDLWSSFVPRSSVSTAGDAEGLGTYGTAIEHTTTVTINV